MIDISKISYAYQNGQMALSEVSLQIEKGESVAIVGQNGAGKTTLAKHINGLLKPSSGHVIVGGLNTKDKTAAQLASRVGYVFQNPDDQIFHNTVRDEIAFALKIKKVSKDLIDDRVLWSSELCQISEFLEENPYNIPYSLRKFVTIASVLSQKPDILIFDEPTSGQDLYGLRTLKNIIEYLKNEFCTVITITHDMEFVAENFQRTVVMANMKKIDDDATRTIFWKENVLKQAALKQPCVSGIAKHIGFNNVLTIDDFIKEVNNVRKV